MNANPDATASPGDPRIPAIFHFIHVGGRPFSFIHYLAVLMASKVNHPECIYFHHTEEPDGIWWERARELLTLHPVAPVREIYGNPITFPAHMADVIRLQMLQRYGGVYLDTDVICINPLEPLMRHACVMGMEPGTGLCNAVILAQPGCEFLHRWEQQYQDFRTERWNYHSVVLPWKLAREHPETIHVADQYAFFYPTHSDPSHSYLWGGRPDWRDVTVRLVKNVGRLTQMRLLGERDAMKLAYYKTFHALRGAHWHYERLRKSYCLHLWESLWSERYLKAVSPGFLQVDGGHFARVMRERLTADELKALGD
ncbi:MAG: glycosyltransferase [Acidobacteria bacterium]|nr:glycosyltransferase [Acidobacteriota bacterium]